ncbi:MAG: hypothetical protein ACYTFI_19575 [Planctomycetota bacterium]
MCGFVFLPLMPVVRMLGFPRDSSVGFSLYGLMPLLLVALGVSCPRLLVNVVGLVLAILACALGYAVGCQLMGSGSVAFNLVSMAPFVVPPYFVLVLLVYGFVHLRRRLRRVG